MTELTATAHYKNTLVFLKNTCEKESKDYTCKRAWFIAKNKRLSTHPETAVDLSHAYINVVKKNVVYDPSIMEMLH